MKQKQKVLAIVGATASGKTALGVALAKKYDGEIISADSMQIYKGLDITTAKPTQGEMQGIVHHCIDFLPRTQNFSVADYVKLARKKIAEIASRGKLPIMVGGTGLYMDSVLNGMQFQEIPEQEQEKNLEEIRQFYMHGEPGMVYHMLQELDPEAAEKIHPHNVVRVRRALEVCLTTGGTFTEYQKKNRAHESPYDYFYLGLDYENRQDLYDRINARVLKMLETGMLEEVRAAYEEECKAGTAGTAAMAIGYKELIPYLEHKEDLEQVIARIQQETRRYAKRQLTWFRRNAQIQWLKLDKNDELQEISEKAEKMIAKADFLCYNRE
ncbi:MAG: tRNA (adenosine(37)-N6)-dimethylallyltransferase MiaA [Oscillospiraceae bacterium]|nr:tRNA (adenosine(37)-N6)-dimethylallyltransferase MiaA [Oscillospiraceae bacterium]